MGEEGMVAERMVQEREGLYLSIQVLKPIDDGEGEKGCQIAVTQ